MSSVSCHSQNTDDADATMPDPWREGLWMARRSTSAT